MNYEQLSKVTDSAKGKKSGMTHFQEVPEKQNKIFDDFIGSKEDLSKAISEEQCKALKGRSVSVRNKFLSRLTDSERRKLLKRLYKVKDDAQLDLYVLGVAFTNYILQPSDFILNQIKELTSGETVPEPIKNLVSKLPLISKDDNDLIVSVEEIFVKNNIPVPPFEGLVSKKVGDSAIDKAIDTDFISPNGKTVIKKDNKTFLDNFISALQKFAEGDEEDLKALVSNSDDKDKDKESVKESEEDKTPKDKEDNSSDKEEDLKDDLKNEEPEDEPDDDKSINKLKDSVKEFANMVLSRGKNIYNKSLFKLPSYAVTDSLILNPDCSCEEYHGLMGPCMKHESACAASVFPKKLLPEIKSMSVDKDKLTITDPEGNVAYWVPICGSADKINSIAEDQRKDFIMNNYIPIDDYFKGAALTNNLGVIYPEFYKKHVSDYTWVSDGVPSGLDLGITNMNDISHVVASRYPSKNSIKKSILGFDYYFDLING